VSTQNVYDSRNLPTNEVLAKYFSKAGIDVLKKIRFDFGPGVCKKKMRNLLRLERFVCNNICYLSDEDQMVIRELVIKNSIKKLDGLCG
jgi:hypothetical protein